MSGEELFFEGVGVLELRRERTASYNSLQDKPHTLLIEREEHFQITILGANGKQILSTAVDEGLSICMYPSACAVVFRIGSLTYKFTFHETKSSITDFSECYDWALYCTITGREVPFVPPYHNERHDANAFTPCEEDKADLTWAVSMMTHRMDVDPSEEEEEDWDGGTETARSTGLGQSHCFADSTPYGRVIVAKELTGERGCVLAAFPYTSEGLEMEDSGNAGVQEFRPTPLANNSPNTAVEPAQLVLTDDDRHVLVRDRFATHTLHDIDLTTGVVVADYHTHSAGEPWPLRCLTPHPGHTHEALVTCTSPQVVFTLDRRLPSRRCVVLPPGRSLPDYALTLRPGDTLTCHATNDAGCVAVGDRRGRVRLYSGAPGSWRDPGDRAKGYHPKTAKTLLPGLGHPILHLDVTRDGGFVLATCERYLIVLSTVWGEGAGEGFRKRMGRHKKLPVRLELTHEQVMALNGIQNVHFGKAVFESNPKGEHWIVANVGNFIARWDFDLVRSAIEGEGPSNPLVKPSVIRQKERVRELSLNTIDTGETPLKYLTDHTIGMRSYTEGAVQKKSSRVGD